MKTTQKAAARADKKSRDCSRAELSFDGFGINGPDEYRTRIATFQKGAGKLIAKYGPMFAASPEMLRVLKMADIGLHPADERGPCLCSQCKFRKAVATVIEEVGQ